MDYVDWDCAECGVKSHMPVHADVTLRESSQTFYCIYGHPNYYRRDKPHWESAPDPEPKITVEITEPPEAQKPWWKISGKASA